MQNDDRDDKRSQFIKQYKDHNAGYRVRLTGSQVYYTFYGCYAIFSPDICLVIWKKKQKQTQRIGLQQVALWPLMGVST